MNTTDSLGHGVGGGEILEFWGNSDKSTSPYLDHELIQQLNAIPLIRILIIIAIFVIMIRLIMNIFNVRTLKKGRGITNELNYIIKVRKYDARVIQYNKLIARVTKFVEHSPFRMNNSETEYLEYNIRRANVRIPGGSRVYKGSEFHAMVVFISFCICLVGLFVTVFANYIIGIMIIISTIVLSGTLPMMILRGIVKDKDLEIKENFADFYLMLHYVLLANSKTPLVSVMKSYAKTTDSTEMIHLVDVCIHYMDTYGEYEGTTHISNAYREIPLIGKLMRLIRQKLAGADVDTELMGFRKELLDAKRYAIEKRTDKLINRAKASFNLLMPILFQAVLSAMSIYFSDMGLIRTFVN